MSPAMARAERDRPLRDRHRESGAHERNDAQRERRGAMGRGRCALILLNARAAQGALLPPHH
jgi:hypothetical protein